MPKRLEELSHRTKLLCDSDTASLVGAHVEQGVILGSEWWYL